MLSKNKWFLLVILLLSSAVIIAFRFSTLDNFVNSNKDAGKPFLKFDINNYRPHSNVINYYQEVKNNCVLILLPKDTLMQSAIKKIQLDNEKEKINFIIKYGKKNGYSLVQNKTRYIKFFMQNNSVFIFDTESSFCNECVYVVFNTSELPYIIDDYEFKDNVKRIFKNHTD